MSARIGEKLSTTPGLEETRRKAILGQRESGQDKGALSLAAWCVQSRFHQLTIWHRHLISSWKVGLLENIFVFRSRGASINYWFIAARKRVLPGQGLVRWAKLWVRRNIIAAIRANARGISCGYWTRWFLDRLKCVRVEEVNVELDINQSSWWGERRRLARF